MDSFADRVRKQPVHFTLEDGNHAIFSEGKCTLVIGDHSIDIPRRSYIAVARILEQGHELLNYTPERGRSR